jgi:hypothetical protein
MVVLGLILPPLAYVAAKRQRQPSSSPQTVSVRCSELIDTLFTIFGLTAVFAWAWLGAKAVLGQWSVAFAAALATAYKAYKIVRLVLELRIGVSVHCGFQSRVGPDHERATRSFAFLWAIAIEVAGLLLGAGVAVALWLVVARGLH